MSEIEYHGWVALASSKSEWADDDWDRAWSSIDKYIDGFGGQDGHAVTITEPTNAIRTLSFHGITRDPADRLLQLMQFVAGVLEASYGELVITPGDRFDWRATRRYRLSEGRVIACDS